MSRASLYSKKLKSSSPQMPMDDMEIIYAIFANPGIREGFGK